MATPFSTDATLAEAQTLLESDASLGGLLAVCEKLATISEQIGACNTGGPMSDFLKTILQNAVQVAESFLGTEVGEEEMEVILDFRFKIAEICFTHAKLICECHAFNFCNAHRQLMVLDATVSALERPKAEAVVQETVPQLARLLEGEELDWTHIYVCVKTLLGLYNWVARNECSPAFQTVLCTTVSKLTAKMETFSNSSSDTEELVAFRHCLLQIKILIFINDSQLCSCSVAALTRCKASRSLLMGTFTQLNFNFQQKFGKNELLLASIPRHHHVETRKLLEIKLKLECARYHGSRRNIPQDPSLLRLMDDCLRFLAMDLEQRLAAQVTTLSPVDEKILGRIYRVLSFLLDDHEQGHYKSLICGIKRRIDYFINVSDEKREQIVNTVEAAVRRDSSREGLVRIIEILIRDAPILDCSEDLFKAYLIRLRTMIIDTIQLGMRRSSSPDALVPLMILLKRYRTLIQVLYCSAAQTVHFLTGLDDVEKNLKTKMNSHHS